MTDAKANQYNRRNIETMEMLYGTGYLSMGGDDEVANIVARVEVAGKDVLDIGCGLGGALIALLGMPTESISMPAFSSVQMHWLTRRDCRSVSV
jgi:2-polyprenyl-3-methyl-5-hydroxy-6-metoxy-1,4-benzoquinol methylase